MVQGSIVDIALSPHDDDMLRKKLLVLEDLMDSEAFSSDAEAAHSAADDLLLDTIRLLANYAGKPDTARRIVGAWGRVKKWYA